MKKLFVLGFFFISLSIYAQGFYFDVGFGFGPTIKGWTKIGDSSINDILDSVDTGDDTSIGVCGELKIGYGPFRNVPLYFVAGLTGISQFVDSDVKNNLPVTYRYSPLSVTSGLGFVFYPLPAIQLGSSISYANTWFYHSFDMRSDFAPTLTLETDVFMTGLSWNASLAFDIGALWKAKSSVLISVNYYYINNMFDDGSLGDWKSSFVGVLIKYAYRQKPKYLF